MNKDMYFVRLAHEEIIENDGNIDFMRGQAKLIGNAFMAERYSTGQYIKLGNIGLIASIDALSDNERTDWEAALFRDFRKEFREKTDFFSELCLGPHIGWWNGGPFVIDESIMMWHRNVFSKSSALRNPTPWMGKG